MLLVAAVAATQVLLTLAAWQSCAALQLPGPAGALGWSQAWESLPESRELRALVVWFCLAAEVSLEVLPLAPC